MIHDSALFYVKAVTAIIFTTCWCVLLAAMLIVSYANVELLESIPLISKYFNSTSDYTKRSSQQEGRGWGRMMQVPLVKVVAMNEMKRAGTRHATTRQSLARVSKRQIEHQKEDEDEEIERMLSMVPSEEDEDEEIERMLSMVPSHGSQEESIERSYQEVRGEFESGIRHLSTSTPRVEEALKDDPAPKDSDARFQNAVLTNAVVDHSMMNARGDAKQTIETGARTGVLLITEDCNIEGKLESRRGASSVVPVLP